MRCLRCAFLAAAFLSWAAHAQAVLVGSSHAPVTLTVGGCRDMAIHRRAGPSSHVARSPDWKPAISFLGDRAARAKSTVARTAEHSLKIPSYLPGPNSTSGGEDRFSAQSSPSRRQGGNVKLAVFPNDGTPSAARKIRQIGLASQ